MTELPTATPPLLECKRVGDGIEVLLLNRPERRNAMVPELMAALAHEVRTRGARADTRALVLGGNGPAFCVGADLKWLGTLPDPAEGIATLVAGHHEVVRAMRQSPVPIAAAVNGAAAGGGMSLALAADCRVAARSATFTAAYFRLGLTPDGGNSTFLVRAIGAARAMTLLLTNRSLSADQAAAWGLVDEVVPMGALMEHAVTFAEHVAGVPAETLLATRRLLDAAATTPILEQLAAEEASMRTFARRPEFSEALARFVQGRPAPPT